MNKNLYSLGLMSGTSLDGIDASIIKSNGEQSVEIIDNIYVKYNTNLKKKLKKIVDSCTSKVALKKLFKSIKKVEKEMTIRHADVCKIIIKRNKKIKVDLIGFHGQTIMHNPQKGYSIQIGDSKLLSKLTKTSVISNFRDNDIKNGGQGAPLASLYHQAILTKIKKLPVAIINIGGISNITYIDKKKIISFDIGPGNYLIDEWVRLNSKKQFDNDGKIAKLGSCNNKILNHLIKNFYFKKQKKKSLDIKDFNLNYLNNLSFKDGCTTLSMLTVKTICRSIKSFKKSPKKIFFSGGGRKNKFILNNIKKISKRSIFLIDRYKFDGDFIESQAFAYLAIRSYLKKYISIPSTTGVKKKCLGGKFFKF